MKNSPVKVFFAGLFGALTGAVGGLLLAPKSGKETREDIAKVARKIKKEIETGTKETQGKVRKVFGRASKEAMSRYEKVKGMVVDRVVAVKGAGSQVDKVKYEKIVDEVVAEFKSTVKLGRSSISRLKSQLKKDWEKVKKALVA